MDLMYQVVYEWPGGRGFRYSGGYESREACDQAIWRLEAAGARIVRIDRGVFALAEDDSRGLMGPRGPLLPS
jgi:hypothetical protein